MGTNLSGSSPFPFPIPPPYSPLYATAFFHFPRLNITALTTESVEKATVIAMKAPFGPMPSGWARSQASGISQHQNTARLM